MTSIRKPYDGKRKRVTYTPTGETMTVQYEKNACDINLILKQYEKTGIVPHLNSAQGVYEDFGEPMAYQEALNALMDAQSSFDELPSALRRFFENDPANLIAFVADENNRDEAIRLGLIEGVIDPDSSAKSTAPEEPDQLPT